MDGGGGCGAEVGLNSYKASLCPFRAGEDSLPVWSPDTMGTRFLLALFLVLLVLGFEVLGAHLPQQEEPASPALLTQMQESLSSYWDSAKAAASTLYQKTYLPTVDEKLRDMYSKSTAAMSTYAGILTDQVFSMLRGEE
ncbi:apolipoprotein C-II [Sapajus apella]|uniref:Apolipoprotein C-II n=1 Tax=Sapajus apella TaxID=9515 RepID=A0A6J3GL11_SAPAP|nr:apolipoprotein C-II [Sapajus apella]